MLTTKAQICLTFIKLSDTIYSYSDSDTYTLWHPPLLWMSVITWCSKIIDIQRSKPETETQLNLLSSLHFKHESLLWTLHQSPDEQKQPGIWQRREWLVCEAICFGGHPKSCVWSILSYPTVPFQECTSLLFTHWAIYCPSLGWHFFP